ncbi:FAD-dependent oxidoreductase [Sphingomonas sp.]|uniref:oxidoreductase n=1 Tax=Sphingomonas sp. TaxID=28214 RepID=UPI003D6CE5AF
MSLEQILSPITINGLEVKNRIARASHGTSYGRGTVNDDLIAYHEARAKSGVGLNILEATVIHRSSANHTVDAIDDSVIPGFTALARSSERHGMRTFVQLWHGGHRWAPASGQAPLSASTVPCPLGLVNTPFAMTQDQIDEITEAYVDAALRVQKSGLDGIELHFGHGYLIHQFLCPLTNRREDDYGGSLDNRMRFGRDVLQAVRDRVGAAYPVGIRLSDYNVPGGLSPDEAGEIVARLCADKMVDYVSGSMGSPYSIATMLGAMDQPAGYMLSSAEPIVARADVPTMIAGRYRTLEEGNQAIREGLGDMVSYVRPMIAEPDLVAKTLSGNAERVRPCIACNQGCIGGIRTAQQRMGCTVNPAVGYELTLSEDLIRPVSAPKKVVIAGGGPAGMEAARLAALSGHKVVLIEAQPALGGTINIAKRAPKLATIGDITYWQEQELYHLGVDVRLSTYAEADDVLAENPDVVIVATGSLPRMDGLQAARPEAPVPGFDRRHVLSSHDLLFMDPAKFGKSAVVFDDVGHYEGIAAAEQLIAHGVKVTFVARHSSFAPQIEVIVRTSPALRRLRQGDFTLVVGGRLVAIGEDTCTLGYLDGEQTWDVPAETVVFISYNEAQSELYRALGGGTRVPKPYDLQLIGDANAPRDLLMAIREGHMAGRIQETHNA